MTTFVEACTALEAAKIAENLAKQARIDAENALLPFVAGKDEGSVTHRAHGWKLTVTFGMNRTVDQAVLDAVREELSPELFEQAFRFKPEVSVSGLRTLQSSEPEAYRIAAQAITAKPAKPSVAIERMDHVKEAA